MKPIINLVRVAFIAVTISAPLAAVPKATIDNVVITFNSGNTKNMATHLDKTVELNILGDEGTFDRVNAEKIVAKFLQDHTPIKFVILFEGGTEPTEYIMGQLTTQKGVYRVNVIFNRKSIIQIRIENYDDNE